MKETSLGEARAEIAEINVAEFLTRSDGQFKRGAFQMIDEDFQIVRLDESVFGSIAEKIIWMAHDELIERRRGSHQHRAGASAAPSRAAGALPGGGDRAWITCHDDGIERADINAKFERAGGNHAANFSVAEAALYFAALVRQVAAAIAANRFGFSRKLRIRLLQIG